MNKTGLTALFTLLHASLLLAAPAARGDEPQTASSPEAPHAVPAAPGPGDFHELAMKEIAAGHPSIALGLIDHALALHDKLKAPENVQFADLLKEKILLSFDLGKSEPLEALADRMLGILIRYGAYDDGVDFQGPVLAVATEFEKRDQPKEAMKLLEASLRFPKRPVFVAVRAAQERAKLGDFEKARDGLKPFFEACKKYDDLCTTTEEAKARVTAGSIELALDNPKGAQKHFRHVDGLSPEARAALPAPLRVLTEYGLGEAARSASHLDEARGRYERSLKEATAAPEQPGLRAYGLSGLARVAVEQGGWEEAEKNAEEAYSIRLALAKNGGTSAPESLSATSLLGGIKLRLGKLDEAETLLKAARKYLAEKSNSDTPESLAVQYHLALLLHARGQTEAAQLELGRLAAVMSDKLGDRSHPAVLAHLELGKIALDRDELFDAENAFRETLALTQKGSPEEAETTLWLGITRMRRGDYPTALKRIEAASGFFEKNPGPASPAFARAQLALGECLAQTQKLKAAQTALEKALELTSAKDEPAYASAQAALGVLLLDAGKPERARELLQSAFELRKKIYGDRHLLVAQCLSGLGRAQAAAGDVDQGLKSLEQAIQIRESAGRADTWQKGQDYLHLAQLYEKAAKPEKALQAYRASVGNFRRSYMPEYPSQIQQAVDGLTRAQSGGAQARH